MERIEKHREKIVNLMNDNPEARNRLFSFGFLFTNDTVCESGYPFWGGWNSENLYGFKLLSSTLTSCSIVKQNDRAIVLIGHMYNPFTMQCDEREILNELLDLYIQNIDVFFEKINEISGIFSMIVLHNGEITLVGDPTGMQTAFYTKIKGKVYISSHQNLIGDICSLNEDTYVYSLRNYKHFSKFGNCLPGDLSAFAEVKRLIPNHFLSVKNNELQIKRFFTIKRLEKSRDQIVEEASEILSNSISIISKKFDRCAISLSGGCDSKTTLATAKDHYDKFKYFSYISNDSEKIDALAARNICSALKLEHKIYEVAEDNKNYENFDLIKEVLYWNCGGILYVHPNEIRKRCCFVEIKDFDYEIKSWCSEIGRAYYSKRFNSRKSFGKKPTPRKCTTLYKVFFENRKLVKQTELIFKDYLEKYFDNDTSLAWQEKFFWEYRVGAWNGLVITGEHRLSYDIIIPYNNRRLLNLLISASTEDRISDNVYKQIREKKNCEVDQLGEDIVNLKHTKKRAIIENLYYTIHSKIPF